MQSKNIVLLKLNWDAFKFFPDEDHYQLFLKKMYKLESVNHTGLLA